MRTKRSPAFGFAPATGENVIELIYGQPSGVRCTRAYDTIPQNKSPSWTEVTNGLLFLHIHIQANCGSVSFFIVR